MTRRIAILIAFLWLAFTVAAQTNVTLTLSVTNITAITNAPAAASFTLSSSVLYWTNSTPAALLLRPTYIAATNTPALATTNLFNKLTNTFGTRFFFSYGSSTSIVIRAAINNTLTASANTNWASLVFTTNQIATTNLSGSLAASNVVGINFTLGGLGGQTINSWDDVTNFFAQTGGGGSGTFNYQSLSNKPPFTASIETNNLSGGTNLSASGIAAGGTLPALNGAALTGLTESQIANLVGDLAARMQTNAVLWRIFTNNASSLTNLPGTSITGSLTNNTTGNASTSSGTTNLYLTPSTGGIFAVNSNATAVVSNFLGLALSSTNPIYLVDADALSYDATFYNSTNFGWYWNASKAARTNQHANMAGYGMFINVAGGYIAITNAAHPDVDGGNFIAVADTNALVGLETDAVEFFWIDKDSNPLVNSGNGHGMDSYYPSTNVFSFTLYVHGGFEGSFAGTLDSASNLPAANISAGVNRGIQAGGSLTNWSSWTSTNIPTRGYTWNVSKVPLLGWDEWNTFESNLTPYSTNRLRWATNAILATETNYLASGWDTIFITDGWQASSRSGGGLTWDTAIYPSPTTLPWLASFAHSHGMKIVLYTSIGTTTCIGRPGSGVDNIYRDIQDMMSWGFDGTMIDVCNGINYADKNYRRAFYRLLNQAIEDFHEMVVATNGIPRPFYVQATLGYANNTPDEFDMDEIYGASAWSVSYGINYNSIYPTNTLNTAKKVLQQLGPYIGPGRFGWAESVYQNGLSASFLTNLANIFCMSLQPWRGAFGTGTSPVFTNGSSGFTGYITNATARFFYTNKEFLNLYRDPSCIPGRVVNTNSLTELWVRPIGGGNISTIQPTNLVYWFNKATTNFTASVNVTNFNGVSNISYTIRDPWLKTTVGTFTNQFTATVNANYGLLYYVFPTTFSGTFNVITNGSNTGTLTFENGVLKFYTP